MEKLKAYQILAGKTYLINNTEKATVLKVIPMQNHDGEIYDVEFLIDKKLNKFFSYTKYYNGESWVKEIRGV